MKNILVIFKKELKSYFASPIAYLLLGIFAVIFGFFFYSATRFFVLQGMQMQMMGRGMPMDVNEYVIRPLLTNASVIGLFLIPMITMRLYAEEKRSGTIELLMTSPVRDLEIVLGKWLAALVLYASVLGVSGINIAHSLRLRASRLEADSGGVSGAHPARRMSAGHRHLHFHPNAEPDHRRGRDVRRLPDALGARLGERLRSIRLGQGRFVSVRGDAL